MSPIDGPSDRFDHWQDHGHDHGDGYGHRPPTAGYPPPRDCPVCGQRFQVSRLGCASCGSELSGAFEACAFCGLNEADRDLLRVFLASRGNLREVERHLGVSYPTARQRFAEVLAKLGLEEGGAPEPAQPVVSRSDVLAKLASGDLDVDTASELLSRL